MMAGTLFERAQLTVDGALRFNRPGLVQNMYDEL